MEGGKEERPHNEDDGFIKVTYKRRTSRPRVTPNSKDICSHTDDGTVDIATFAAMLARTVYELQRSDYLKNFEKILERAVVRHGVEMSLPSQLSFTGDLAIDLKMSSRAMETKLDIVCYGLGRILSSVAARTQLALLLLLGVGLCAKVYVYDPVFSAKEREVLEFLSLHVLPYNEEGKRSINKPTLFFMPYCPHELYNNLLWANWSVKKLSQLIIIGNSFKVIVDDLPRSTQLEDSHYLYEAVKFVEETSMPYTSNQYFYGLSIHIFDSGILHALPDVIWLNHDEPQYKFTEMITCN